MTITVCWNINHHVYVFRWTGQLFFFNILFIWFLAFFHLCLSLSTAWFSFHCSCISTRFFLSLLCLHNPNENQIKKKKEKKYTCTYKWEAPIFASLTERKWFESMIGSITNQFVYLATCQAYFSPSNSLSLSSFDHESILYKHICSHARTHVRTNT